MTELLQYLYQPTGFTNYLLNITLAGLLMTIVIGFIALHTKRTMTKRFFFTWLFIGIILGTGAAYSTIVHRQEMSSLNKNDVTITRRAGQLLVEGKKPYVKTSTFTIEDESDNNVYVKIGTKYVKIAKSEVKD